MLSFGFPDISGVPLSLYPPTLLNRYAIPCTALSDCAISLDIRVDLIKN